MKRMMAAVALGFAMACGAQEAAKEAPKRDFDKELAAVQAQGDTVQPKLQLAYRALEHLAEFQDYLRLQDQANQLQAAYQALLAEKAAAAKEEKAKKVPANPPK